ncbi:ATP-binding cassette domain-containing protein [Plesiomonas shigelloides subsp. oncorhynchi]|nr:ATP-binding cassette domain-containing protein [Plesiomonas shigelloides]
MTVVELRNLTLQRGRRQILSQLSLDLRAGELTVLLGPNGTGKSTLLKCISGEMAAQGEIRLFGQPQSQWPAPILARRMAILPQSSALSFSFLAREVVALGRLPHASGKIADEAIIQRCLQAVGAEHLADSAYTVLSGGKNSAFTLRASSRSSMSIWPTRRRPSASLPPPHRNS